ncbi:MAG: hypothetical protein ACPHAN_02885 [Pseudomonadales bacterium]
MPTPSMPNPRSPNSESSSESQSQTDQERNRDQKEQGSDSDNDTNAQPGQSSSEQAADDTGPTNPGSQLEEIGKALERAGASERQEPSESDSQGNDAWDPLMPEPEPSQSATSDTFETSEMAIPTAAASAASNGDMGSDEPVSDAQGGDTTGSQPEEGQDADQPASSENNTTSSASTSADGEPSIASEGLDSSTASAGTGNEAQNAPSDNPENPGMQSDRGAPRSGLDDPSNGMMEDLAVALEQAGIALQSAGAALNDDDSGDSEGDVEAALTDANIAVLVAEQALEAVIANTDSPSPEMTADISDAARLIILAGSVLSDAQGIPNGPEGEDLAILGAPSGADRLGQLDAELEASITIFESEVQESRDAVASILSGPAAEAVGGPGPSLDDIGTGMLEPEDDTGEGAGEDLGDPGALEPIRQGRMIDGENTDSSQGSAQVPDDIPSPQGDDIVAKQLREAASAEKDPDLRAKLWEEYKRYKEGL